MTYHLYSDGNYFPRAKKSGFGGYIEDPKGELVIEYTEQIKQTEYIHSFELLGIIRGLQIAKDKGIDNIVSHCDDKNTASRLKEIFEQNINKATMKPELYEKIIELSKSFKKIKFEYIPRAQNKYADSLSRRYASLMEDNFLKHYDQELLSAERKFAQNTKTSKRLFFSHPSLVRNPNKNNPYLVAPTRNKKVRKVSRAEELKDYQFLYIETFKDSESMTYRSFLYDNKRTLSATHEKTILLKNTTVSSIGEFCEFVNTNLATIKSPNIWLYSNNRTINAYFEQKEKIPGEQFADFHKTYQAMNAFKQVFFHHFPFPHQFSPEIENKEIKKQKLDFSIDNLDNLMEQLGNEMLGREKNKCFGNLIRCTLRNYKHHLQRELLEVEKTEIIEKTTAHLTGLGFTNLPNIKPSKSL